MLLALLIGTLNLASKVEKAEASGTIYIRADGSIDAPTPLIVTVDNVTYTLTGNINGSIVVERDNVVVDGAGYTVQGTGNATGIDLTGRKNTTIRNMEIRAFYYGIWLGFSSNNSVVGNNITNNHEGISLGFSLYNSVVGNNITNNAIGIWLGSSSNNSVIGNNITNNSWAGIDLCSSSSHNVFYDNNFIGNTLQVYIEKPEYANVWDDGYPSGGNYWSDYTGVDVKSGSYQNETGSESIGDTPYIIDANNTDHYPLVGMFQSYDVTYYTLPLVAHSCNVTVISNSTVSNFVAPIWLEHPEVILIEFNVTEEQGTTGFCRVSFPTAMMNGTYHVFVNGTEVPYILLLCSNADYSYLYFTYTHSTEGVIIILEFPSFLILPLFVIATLLAVIFYRRRMEAEN